MSMEQRRQQEIYRRRHQPTPFDDQIQQELERGWRIESRSGSFVTLVRGHRPNHILHLLISVFTAGLWLPVWLLVGLKGEERKVMRAPSSGHSER